MTTKAKTEAPLRLIATSLIMPTPNTPRKDLGDLTELTASIEAHGIIQPILVRRLDDGYECVAGSRRLAVANAIRMVTVPCHVREMDDNEAHELALTENIMRKDMSLIDEIHAVEALTLSGDSRDEIAARFGRTPKWVATRKKIAGMPQIVLDKIADGSLSISDAEILCKLNDEETIIDIVEDSDDIAEEVNRRLRELSGAPWATAKSACAKCLLRSDKQINLFEDGGPARCMDLQCWNEKRALWIEKKGQELRNAGHLPKETWHNSYNIENGYGGYLLEGRDDEQIAELVEAGIKPRYHITPENEVVLRYFYPDLPEKTVKTASGDDEPEVEIEGEDEDTREAESCPTVYYDHHDEDEEEEATEPRPEPYYVRKRRLQDAAIEQAMGKSPDEIDRDSLLEFTAEALRRNTSVNPMDEKIRRDGVISVVGMDREQLTTLLLATVAAELYAEPGDDNYSDWEQFAETFGIVEGE